MDINVTVTHTLSPKTEAFLSHLFALAVEGRETTSGEPDDTTATPGQDTTPHTGHATETADTKKKRRTRAEIEADRAAAEAQSKNPVTPPTHVYQGGETAATDPFALGVVAPSENNTQATPNAADLDAMLFGTQATAPAPIVVTLEQARELAGTKAKLEGKHEAVFALMKSIGITSVSELSSPAMISEFYTKLTKL